MEDTATNVANEITRIRKMLKDGEIDSQTKEQQIRSWVIDPLLRALGWNTGTREQVYPEFPIDRSGQRGSADYALLNTRGSPAVLIEAKKIEGNNERAEEQLFAYAAHEGIPLLALTTGVSWDLYLAMAPGRPAERRFTTVNLEDGGSDSAALLERFLSRDNVLGDRARREAEAALDAARDREKAQEALPKIWERVKDDDLIVELLEEETEKECGVKPDRDDVKKFLAGVLDRGVATRATKPKKIPAPATALLESSRSSAQISTQRQTSTPTGGRRRSPRPATPPPAAIILFGTRYKTSSSKDVIVTLARTLVVRHQDRLARESGIGGRKNNYMKSTSTGMIEPKPIGRVGRTEWFLETSLSVKDVFRRCNVLLNEFGYSESDLEVIK